jgi:hypothetical protein
MIRTLAWKEYREQRAFWAALATLSAVVSAVVFVNLGRRDPFAFGWETGSALGPVLLVLATTYGLVCGAMTLASDVEGGTLPFLDTLPASRRAQWQTKMLMGVALCSTQALFVVGLFLGAFFLSRVSEGPGEIVLVATLALTLEAFAWGIFLSAYCRSVLAAASGAAVVVAALWLLTFTLAESAELYTVVLGRVLFALLALEGSGRRYCRDDRERRAGGRAVSGRTVLLWLAFRQGGRTVLVLAILGPLLAELLARQGLPGWGPVAFLTGVMCGLSAFLGEQASGTFQFLGDCRVPPGRVWRVKTGAWFATALLLTALIGIVAKSIAGTTYGGVASNPVADEMLGLVIVFGNDSLDILAIVFVWLMYGFAAGQLCALVFRKAVVAAAMALLAGGTALALCFLSLKGGEVAYRQLLVAPLVLLATTRALVWPWMTGRLYTGRSVATLLSGVLLAGAALAGTLWYQLFWLR